MIDSRYFKIVESKNTHRCSLCTNSASYEYYCNHCQKEAKLYCCSKCFMLKGEESLFKVHKNNSECFLSVNLS